MNKHLVVMCGILVDWQREVILHDENCSPSSIHYALNLGNLLKVIGKLFSVIDGWVISWKTAITDGKSTLVQVMA